MWKLKCTWKWSRRGEKINENTIILKTIKTEHRWQENRKQPLSWDVSTAMKTNQNECNGYTTNTITVVLFRWILTSWDFYQKISIKSFSWMSQFRQWWQWVAPETRSTEGRLAEVFYPFPFPSGCLALLGMPATAQRSRRRNSDHVTHLRTMAHTATALSGVKRRVFCVTEPSGCWSSDLGETI